MIFMNLHRNNKASAAIEFALLLPFMLILLFGAVEVSNYVLVVRKVENAANDVAFLLSREGNIHDIDANGTISAASEDFRRVERIATAVIGATTYPYAVNNYELEIRSIARPKNASIAPDDARLMWAHRITRTAGATNPARANTATFSTRASTSNVSGTSQPSSIYSDPSGDRAELVFAGQTFLVVNFAYGYDQIINNMMNFIALDFEANDVEKLATYAARSRWVDGNGDGNVQANEFFNEMQTCTGCSVFQSNSVSNPCETGAALALAPKTSGCKFN